MYQVWVLVRLRTEVLYYFNSFRIEFLIVCIINRSWTSGKRPHTLDSFFLEVLKPQPGSEFGKRSDKELFQFYFKVKEAQQWLSREKTYYFRFGWRLEMDITFEDAQFYAVLVVSIVSFQIFWNVYSYRKVLLCTDFL